MKLLNPSSYTFVAASKTVTCSDFATVGLARILMICNVTRGVIIYNPASSSTNGTLSGSTLTLTYDTTTHNDADTLQIFIDDSYAVARETGNLKEITEVLETLTLLVGEFTERLDVYSDGSGRLQVALTNSTAQGALSSITTLTSLTALYQLGGYQYFPAVEASLPFIQQMRQTEMQLIQQTTSFS